MQRLCHNHHAFVNLWNREKRKRSSLTDGRYPLVSRYGEQISRAKSSATPVTREQLWNGLAASSRCHGICSVKQESYACFRSSGFQDCKQTKNRKLLEPSKKASCHRRAGTAETQRRFLIGCQIAWVIYKNFRIDGESEAILDFGDLTKVMLTNDDLQFLDT